MAAIKSKLQPGSKGEDVQLLHEGLHALGGGVAPSEVEGGVFGDTTKAAVLAFQTQYGLEPTGIVDSPTAVLLTAAARFTAEGNTAEMRLELLKALQANPKQPTLAHWLARYEIIARDYTAARDTLDKLRAMPDADGFLAPLANIVSDPAQNRSNPEVLYPANFYTYRYSFLEFDTITRLLNGLAESTPAVAPNPSLQLNQTSVFLLPQDGERDIPIDPSDPPPTPPRPPRIPLPGPGAEPQVELAGYHAMLALWHWFLGIQDLSRGLFARAVDHYNQCQVAVVDYFRLLNPEFLTNQKGSLSKRLILLMTDLHRNRVGWHDFFQSFDVRATRVSLEELRTHDWSIPAQVLAAFPEVQHFLGMLRESDEVSLMSRQLGLEAPLIKLAYILVPLARAEANRQRRQFHAAIRDCDRVLGRLLILNPDLGPPPQGPDIPAIFTMEAPFKLVAMFIELPFARQLKARVLLDKADAEYKARAPADPKTFPEADQYQGLQAAQTYLQVTDLFADEGDYKARVESATTRLRNELKNLLTRRFHPLAPPSTGTNPLSKADRHHFLRLGKEITIPTVGGETETFPGLDRRSGPHEPLLRFEFPAAGATTNPVIYALVTEAQARLLQIAAGFNYLGYRDEYIPPWRFQFLLERGRYFAEHAKNAQREYLNFLNNAEQQEFQELTAAQSVELEKSNIRIETARVEQTRLEMEATKLGAELAQLQAENAGDRLEAYRAFDDYADSLTGFGIAGDIINGSIGFLDDLRNATSGLSDILIAPPGFASALPGVGGAASHFQQFQLQSAQREYEKLNLALAIDEANKSVEVARKQLEAAEAGLVVTGLQRAAALLRHEFALQNLNFLRSRTLNAEIWYRLAAMSRDIGATYMRYAVELAFLAEQAYEFEADKRINVIRFDYDVSEVGSLLAADFLLRDLDTIEQDLIVNQRQRQQQVRFVLSLANEFPEALQELRDTGSTIFSLRLEQLERRFPGLFNIRIGAVDVTPVALMNPARFSLELTYMGISQLRLKAQPDTPPGVPSPSPLNTDDLEHFLFDHPSGGHPNELDKGIFSSQLRQVFKKFGVEVSSKVTVTPVEPGFVWRIVDNGRSQIYLVKKTDKDLVVQLVKDDWLLDIRDQWPVKIRTTGPETAVFSGLTLQERAAIFPFVSTSQRNIFEGLGAAGAWRIDMSMKENQVVPGTLVDLLITFTLSGYHDVDLRTAVDQAQHRATVMTQWLSARQRFADAFYEFNHGGRMIWDVTANMLSLNAPARNLRNLGIILLSAPRRVQLSRLMSSYMVELEIAEDGQFQLLAPIPELTISISNLNVTAAVAGVGDATISWDFGEGDGFQSNGQHAYRRPGEYRVGLRLVQDGRLYEYHAEIDISRTESLTVPLTAFPVFAPAPDGQNGVLASANVPGSEEVAIIWKVDQEPAERAPEKVLNLQPGRYVVAFTAMRQLKGRIYCQQRFVPDRALEVDGLHSNTNRVFDLDGSETTGSGNNAPANALTEHLFPLDTTSNQRLVLSPVDRWMLELRMEENPCLRSVTVNDNVRIALNEVQDAILILEYETGMS